MPFIITLILQPCILILDDSDDKKQHSLRRDKIEYKPPEETGIKATPELKKFVASKLSDLIEKYGKLYCYTLIKIIRGAIHFYSTDFQKIGGAQVIYSVSDWRP